MEYSIVKINDEWELNSNGELRRLRVTGQYTAWTKGLSAGDSMTVPAAFPQLPFMKGRGMHWLVAHYFVKEHEHFSQFPGPRKISHIDKNRKNNRAENLVIIPQRSAIKAQEVVNRPPKVYTPKPRATTKPRPKTLQALYAEMNENMVKTMATLTAELAKNNETLLKVVAELAELKERVCQQ